MKYKQYREYVLDKNILSNIIFNYFNIVKEGNEFAINFLDSSLNTIIRVLTFKNNSWKLKGNEIVTSSDLFSIPSYSNNSKLLLTLSDLGTADTGLYELNNNNWVDTSQNIDNGVSIISRNGNFIFALKKIYKLNEGIYEEINELSTSDISIGNFSNNGNIFCLYPFDDDDIPFKIYKFNGTSFVLYQDTPNYFNSFTYNNKFLSGNGKTVGIPNSEVFNILSLRIFRDNGTEFVLLKDFNISTEEKSINDVAFSFDGNTMVLSRPNVIGDNFIGQIEIYKYINNNWKLINIFPSNINENSPIKVSISNNGKIVGQLSYLSKDNQRNLNNLNKVIFYKLDEKKKKSIVLYKKYTGCKIICKK